MPTENYTCLAGYLENVNKTLFFFMYLFLSSTFKESNLKTGLTSSGVYALVSLHASHGFSNASLNASCIFKGNRYRT